MIQESLQLPPAWFTVRNQRLAFLPRGDLLGQAFPIGTHAVQLVVADPIGQFGQMLRVRALGGGRRATGLLGDAGQAAEEFRGVGRFLAGVRGQAK